MSPKANSQLGPATALVQLLTEHPELPRLRWSIGDDGVLSGSCMSMPSDPRPAIAAYAAVLGGTPLHLPPREGGVSKLFNSWLSTTWRDVEVSVWMGCDGDLIPAEAPQAVAA